MSISSTFSHAASGLATASRSAQLVASNIANAATEGYAPRSLTQSSGPTGGVRIDGVMRNISPLIIADRRNADAAQRQSQDLSVGLSKIERLLGTPLQPSSIAGRLTAFETLLVEAASRPESTQRLAQSVQAAMSLAETFRTVSDGLQDMRTQADREIASLVDQVNTDLTRLQKLNRDITVTQIESRDSTSLQDQRQTIVDRIAQIIPVTEVQRQNGAIALFTTGGAILLDSSAARLGFSPVNLVAPQMTQANGLLSGITLNGKEVSTDPLNGLLRGGALDAAFQLRDQEAVQAQGLVDGLAQDLIERFSLAGLDPSVPLGQPALFTDEGQVIDPSILTGLAGRLVVNAAVDPSRGGSPERLRDGLRVSPSASSGNSSLLSKMIATLEDARLPVSPTLGSGAKSFSGLVVDAMSLISAKRQTAEQNQSFTGSKATALKLVELEQGVDTDSELQNLMRIEQAFAANAKVIQAVDEMMNNLLRI